jgi:molybdate transport system substrate-binding protein
MLGMPAVAACGTASGNDDETLTVFAAASLTAAFEELGDAFQEANPGTRVEFNFAGSQALATQLAEGASADIFAAANPEQMERAVRAGVIDGAPVVFANNRLVVIAPDENPAGVGSVFDLADPDLKLVVAAEDVPAGRYAREMLGLLEQSAELRDRYPDFESWSIVSNEVNVLQVVTRVRLGEADAGIVYATDVTPAIAAEVIEFPIPERFNVVADYPIAAVADGNFDLASEFIGFVRSAEGTRILSGWGFQPAGS